MVSDLKERQGLSYVEAGKLGAAASKNIQKQAAKQRREFYLKNPKLCIRCSEIIPYEKRKHNTFCSHSCRASFQNPILRKKYDFSCKQCVKKVKGNKLFCSSECGYKFRKNLLIQKWKNGLVQGYVGLSFAIKAFIRNYLFEKYDNKCCKCSWSLINPKSKKIPLQVNHIDGNPKNCKEENLELLCPNCHSLTPNFGRLNKYSPRFRKYLRK